MDNKKFRKGALFLPSLIILFGTALIALPAFGSIHHILANYVVDDTFYYILPALNFGNGAGLSFDTIHLTNGFQPLWMLALLPVAFLAENRDMMLRATLFYQAVIFACAALLMVWSAYRHRLPVTMLALAVLFMAFGIRHDLTMSLVTNGLESSLFFLMLAIAFVTTLRVTEGGSPTVHVIALSLLVLTRLDAVVIAAPLWLYALWSQAQSGGWLVALRRNLWGIAIGVLLLVAYVGSSYNAVGEFTPVSGQIKLLQAQRLAEQRFDGWATWPFVQEVSQVFVRSTAYVSALTTNLFLVPPDRAAMIREKWITTAGQSAGAVTALLLLLIPLLWHQMRRRHSAQARWQGALAAMGVGVLLYQLVHSIFLWPFAFYNVWHYVGAMFVIIVAIATVLERLLQSVTHRWPVMSLAFVLLLSVAVALSQRSTVQQSITALRVDSPLPANERAGLYRAGQWTNNALPSDDLLGAFNAGIAGYSSDASLVNLDGLINDATILHLLEQGQSVGNYIYDEQIDYIVDYAPQGGYPLPELGSMHYIDMYTPDSNSFVMNLTSDLWQQEGEGLIAAWPVDVRVPSGEMEAWIGTAWRLPPDEVANHVWFVADEAGEFVAGPFEPVANWFHQLPPPSRNSNILFSYYPLPATDLDLGAVVVHNVAGVNVIGPAELPVSTLP